MTTDRMRRKIDSPVAQRLARGNAISKACAVLTTLSAAAPLRLNEIAEATGLNRVTALRILEDLTEAGFLTRSGSPPRYDFGNEIHAIAAAAARSQNPREAMRPALLRLAAFCGDTVLLSIRSGAEAICVERAVGDFPIRANYLHVGSRRPLGVGAGSMTLLASLPPEERATILDLTCQNLTGYPLLTREKLEAHFRHFDTHGHVAMYDQIVDMMGAIGIPVLGRHGQVVGAVSIVGLTDRIRGREALLVAAVRKEVRHTFPPA